MVLGDRREGGTMIDAITFIGTLNLEQHSFISRLFID